MSQLEVKEKELNKLKQESDQLVLNQHPASDKIEVSFMRFTCLLGEKKGNFSRSKTVQMNDSSLHKGISLFYILGSINPEVDDIFLERTK